MRRTLLIPSAVALGAHALLLFGFKPAVQAVGHEPSRPTPPTVIVVEPPLVIPPEPAAVETDPTTISSPRAAASVPVLPETPRPVEPGDITIQMPPTPPTRVTGTVMDRIPPVWSARGSEGDGIGVGAGPLISPDLLDNPPRTRYQPAPQYPFSAKQSGLSGEVVVSFEVDERGAVLRPSVVRSTAREFEEPTLRAVEKWRFQPGKKDGRPVRFRMVVPVVFNLTADA